MLKNIVVKGAKEHNLKNLSVEIPRDKFVVITGLSGSGKSSLAFDTIYAEGQRRYVESLSAYGHVLDANPDHCFELDAALHKSVTVGGGTPVSSPENQTILRP